MNIDGWKMIHDSLPFNEWSPFFSREKPRSFSAPYKSMALILSGGGVISPYTFLTGFEAQLGSDFPWTP